MKKKIVAKISRKDLEKIAQQIAPAPVKTPTKTPTPSKPGRQNPFKPPQPLIMPKPKARRSNLPMPVDESPVVPSLASEMKRLLKVAQVYEHDTHKSGRDFWENMPEDHPFFQNPIFAVYGKQLTKENYDDIMTKMREKGGQIYNQQSLMGLMREVMSLLQQIENIEKNHREELVEAAKDITCEYWGIDRDMLKADIGEQPEQSGEDEETESAEINPRLRDEINKRLIMNTMTQGSALNAMHTVHYLVKDKLDAISPELTEIYTRLSGLVTHHYYIIDIKAVVEAFEQMGGVEQAGLGWSHVEYQDGEPVVVAQGKCFPVLCQELFKGVMELLSLHGIPEDLSAEELKTIYQNADRLQDEPWIIMIGPALWRKFLAVVPKGVKLAEVISQFAKETPENVYRIISQVIQRPEAAKQLLEKYRIIEEDVAPEWEGEAEWTEQGESKDDIDPNIPEEER